MGRAPCCDKANVKKGPWSPEEDAKLKAYIEEHGTGGNWIALPHKIGLKRCGKSCRLRWLNYLRPNIKHGGFSEQEDQIILSLYISIGSRWSIIAAQLPGRTDNDIKNYWNTRLKKKLLGKRRESSQSRCFPVNNQVSIVQAANNAMSHETTHSQTLSASALERMQLHMQLQGLYDPFFYNNPALWPKHHPLGNKLFESHAVSPTLVQQHPSNGAMIESSHRNLLQMKHDIQNSMGQNVQEDMDHCSTLGFCSPSSTGGLGVENPCSDYSSSMAGPQPDLHEMFHGKTSSLRFEVENQLADELDCFKEMNGEKESVSWWSGNGFEKAALAYSVSSLQLDSMLQEYALGYDL